MSEQPAYIALDLEATGGGADDEIIEIGAVKFAGEQALDRFETLVRPSRPVTLRVQELTGIRNVALHSAPVFAAVRAKLAAFVGDLPLVAHSVELDRERLQRQGLALANPGYDTYELAGILLPGLAGYGLAAVAEELGVETNGQHRALADAETTRLVFQKLFARLAALDPRTLKSLNMLLAQSTWPLRFLLREAERQTGADALSRPIPAPGELSDDGLPLARPAPDITPLEPSGAPKPLDLAALHAVWSPTGPLAQTLPNFERRPQQEEMSAAIGRAFNTEGRLLVEAGTGTGKTLAYLVPATQWALQNGERVVVSTNTVNLQDQIRAKDVPDLERALGKAVRVHVLKGRGNYLCLLRWADFRNRRPGGAPLSPLESRVLVKVLLWLGQTTTGDVADLNLTGEEQALWGEIAATQDTCINDACRFKQRRSCFLFAARRAAEAAHLLIVNHALLLSDLAADNAVLPEYQHLILDEAHHLEEQATKQLGFDLQRRDFYALLGEVYSAADPARPSGLTQDLLRALPRGDAAGERTIERLLETERTVERAREAGARFFAVIAAFAAGYSEGGRAAQERPGGYERQIRLTSRERAHPLWPGVQGGWEDLGVVLAELQELLERIAQDLDTLNESLQSDLERQALLLSALNRRLLQARVEVEALVQSPAENRVYWLSQGEQVEALGLHSAPLNVGELLAPLLFAPRQTVVLTSATLTVHDRFEYVQGRLGLEDAETVQIGSPFDYRRQALVYLPEDLADPMAPAYTGQVHQALIEFASASRGRCLALFTSHAALRAAYRAIKGPLEAKGIVVVAQGLDGSRNQLVQTLRTHHATVILGSASFWEGVDVAGEALSALAIVKLPFTVPSDPVFAARCEQFDRPFDQYAVPQAVLRFKQGFGRLIRTATDRGVLLMLDRRVTSKYYGRQFLESLPDCALKRGKLREIAHVTAEWLGRGPLS